MLRRTVALILVACSLTAIALALGTNSRAASRASANPPSKVRPEVLRAVAAQGRARVLITLATPEAMSAGRPDVPKLRAEVAASQSDVLARLPEASFAVSRRYAAVPALAGSVDADGLEALEQDPAVAEIALDGVGSAALAQSVPLINADDAHTSGLTGAGITVAVLDTGIDTDHPDFTGAIAYEQCYLTLGGCPGGAHPAEDGHGHGTNVSGIIAGRGNVAPPGVAPGAQIAAYKILSDADFGLFSDWTAALDDIIANHPEVDIINMSLQSTIPCPAGAMTTAVDTLRALGKPTFIAAGNYGLKNLLRIPACIPSAFSVGAAYDANIGQVNGWDSSCVDSSTSADLIACWSNSDGTLDLLGPGAAITSAGVGGGTSTYYGTSQATPHAAGVAALLLEAFPSLTADDIETRLEATGTLLTDDLDDADPATNRITPRIDARVALLADGDDSDGDGCTNLAEYGADQFAGGRRRPLHFWDFFDTPDHTNNLRDKVVSGLDFFRILGRFNSAGNASIDPLSAPPAPPAYHTAYDRGAPLAGGDPWGATAANGSIAGTDFFAMLAQFGHSCATPGLGGMKLAGPAQALVGHVFMLTINADPEPNFSAQAFDAELVLPSGLLPGVSPCSSDVRVERPDGQPLGTCFKDTSTSPSIVYVVDTAVGCCPGLALAAPLGDLLQVPIFCSASGTYQITLTAAPYSPQGGSYYQLYDGNYITVPTISKGVAGTHTMTCVGS